MIFFSEATQTNQIFDDIKKVTFLTLHAKQLAYNNILTGKFPYDFRKIFLCYLILPQIQKKKSIKL